jgi:hypothetical protein
MFLEGILILAVIGIILVVFYKQAIQEFRILQTDSLQKAQTLLHERCPIVVLPMEMPEGLWTQGDVAQRPTLQATPVNGKFLKDQLKQESVQLTPQKGEELAKAISLPVWIEQRVLPAFKENLWWGSLLTARSEATIGAQGMRQTAAYATALLCTEGALSVSLVNGSSNAYLPTKWQGKRVKKLTRDDAPLLKQIQYVDVIVRPGSALLIPPHWKVSWENHEAPTPALGVWIEIHHPLSNLMRRAIQ